MRSYVVQAGDSPAKIAIKYAGCPKCLGDLIDANPSKPLRVFPGGFRTFASLAVGERLVLPDKWFDGTLDRLSRDYFDRLPQMPTQAGGVGAPPQGLGATVGGALSHCDAFSMNVTLSNSQGDPHDYFDTNAFNITVSPQLSDGSYQVNGIYTGPAGFSWQDGSDWHPVSGGTDTMTINSFTVTGTSTVGPCAPSGQPKPGGGPLPGGFPGGPGSVQTCAGNTVPDAATGACVQPCPDGSAPSNGACGGGKTGTTPFQYVTGHRIQAIGTPTAGGALPASVANATAASVQAQFDAVSPGQYKVVSVGPSGGSKFSFAAIKIVIDYCGPTQSVLDPSSALSSEGVAMMYTHTDLGASPAGTTCKPAGGVTAPSGGVSTGTVALGGLAIVAAVGGLLYAVR